jgi:cytochrome oxidase Cu insertion factor (SCO1/SenC/PrrC family)
VFSRYRIKAALRYSDQMKVALLLWACLAASAQTPAPPTGPNVGQKIPPFEARDQNGRAQTFETLKGKQGLVLLFVRSADW